MSRRGSKNDVIAAIQAMVAGLEKHFPGQTLVLGGVAMSVDELVDELAAYPPEVAAAAAAQVAWKLQLAAESARLATKVAPVLGWLRHYLIGTFGGTSPTLADFGLVPQHPRPRSAQAKATAVEKSLATRVARGTMGKRQRAKIHGAVPPATPPPTTAPASAPVEEAPLVPKREPKPDA